MRVRRKAFETTNKEFTDILVATVKPTAVDDQVDRFETLRPKTKIALSRMNRFTRMASIIEA